MSHSVTSHVEKKHQKTETLRCLRTQHNLVEELGMTDDVLKPDF